MRRKCAKTQLERVTHVQAWRWLPRGRNHMRAVRMQGSLYRVQRKQTHRRTRETEWIIQGQKVNRERDNCDPKCKMQTAAAFLAIAAVVAAEAAAVAREAPAPTRTPEQPLGRHDKQPRSNTSYHRTKSTTTKHTIEKKQSTAQHRRESR